MPNCASTRSWSGSRPERVVDPDASGQITLDGNGLQSRITWRGARRSVALNSLRVVLFDLAAMLCAVRGKAYLPAFLLHDSPREGDLDMSTYRRLFRAVLELAADHDQAPFQYIVTTTTDPPANMRGFVRLELGSVDPLSRLLRVDLL